MNIGTLWKWQKKMGEVSLSACYKTDKISRVVKSKVPMPLELFHAIWYCRSVNKKEFKMQVMPPAKRTRVKRVSMRWSWNLTYEENDSQWKKVFPDVFRELKGPRQVVMGHMMPVSNVSMIYDVINEELRCFFRYRVTLGTN